MRTILFRLMLSILLSAPASIVGAQDPESVLVGDEYYRAPPDLNAATIWEGRVAADRIDVSPSGNYAIAIHADESHDDETGEVLTTYGLLVLDRREKKIIRELNA